MCDYIVEMAFEERDMRSELKKLEEDAQNSSKMMMNFMNQSGLPADMIRGRGSMRSERGGENSPTSKGNFMKYPMAPTWGGTRRRRRRKSRK